MSLNRVYPWKIECNNCDKEEIFFTDSYEEKPQDYEIPEEYTKVKSNYGFGYIYLCKSCLKERSEENIYDK